jgi:hypothetical protein
LSSFRVSLSAVLVFSWIISTPQKARSQERDSIPPVEIGGFVDSYYSLNTARPASHTNRYRNFDLTAEEFVLSEAQVDIKSTPAPIGFHISLNMGSTSDIIHGTNTSTMNLLMQGYLSFIVPIGEGLTVDAGKFVTHMGYETIGAKDNFNYSRSFLFAWAIPYYHVGMRVMYPLLKQLTLGASITNGWNAAAPDNRKTYGGTVTYAPLPFLSLTANWIGGPGEPDSNGTTFRQVAELVPVFQITEALTFAADLVYGTERTPGDPVNWKGAALYARYGLTANSAISARGEIYDDHHGFTTGVTQKLGEMTLTYEYKMLQNLLMRIEYRHDRSDVGVFDGSSGDAIQSQQNTFAVCGIVTF